MTRTHNRGNNRLTLILLILLFGLPPLAGWLFFMNPQWLPEGRKNHGTLILPPRPLSALTLQNGDNSPFDWNHLKGHWTLVYANEGACNATCREQLQRLQQVRRAVGADRQHIEHLLIQERSAMKTAIPSDGRQTAGARVLYLDPSQHRQFEELFALPETERKAATYLIDPNGMLMMAHDRGQPTKAILQDLELLLKASRNWIKGVNNGYG